MTAKVSLVELLVSNAVFLLAVALCESNLLVNQLSCKFVKYDNIALIVPERREEMIADLEKRLGVKVVNVEIGSVDFLRDTALIKVFYKGTGSNGADDLVKMPKEYDEISLSFQCAAISMRPFARTSRRFRIVD